MHSRTGITSRTLVDQRARSYCKESLLDFMSQICTVSFSYRPLARNKGGYTSSILYCINY